MERGDSGSEERVSLYILLRMKVLITLLIYSTKSKMDRVPDRTQVHFFRH